MFQLIRPVNVLAVPPLKPLNPCRWALILSILCFCQSRLFAELQSLGTNIGPVQFDAIIQISPAARHTEALFARYWVSTNYYQFAIIWVEPHGRGISFPVYPPTLAVCSDSNSFTIKHDIYSRINAAYPKPFGQEEIFTNMFGDYSIGSARWADQFGSESHIYSEDLGAITNTKTQNDEAYWVSFSHKTPNGVTDLNLRVSSQRINSIDFIDGRKKAFKHIDYTYGTNEGLVSLERENISIKERPIAVRLPGKGMSVRLNAVDYQFTNIVATRNKGGRDIVVQYKPIAFDKGTVALPDSITVANDNTKTLLRSAKLLDIKKTEFTVDQAKGEAQRFGAFNSAQHQYRDFLVKYWKTNPNNIPKADLDAIKALRDSFQKPLPVKETFIGEDLRRLNIVMELDRLIADEPDLKNAFELYLRTLATNKLDNLVLIGGCNAIDTSILWGRVNEANILLVEWLEISSQCNDPPSVHEFSSMAYLNGNHWAIVKLLQRFLQRKDLSEEETFEFNAMQYMALRRIKALSDKKEMLRDEVAKAELNWVASYCGMDSVEKAALSIKSKAESELKNLKAESSEDISLQQAMEDKDEQNDVIKKRLLRNR